MTTNTAGHGRKGADDANLSKCITGNIKADTSKLHVRGGNKMFNRYNNKKTWQSALFITAIAIAVLALMPQTAAAQSGSNLQPPQNVQKDEGTNVTFGVTVDDVPQADIISVVVSAVSNKGVSIANLDGNALSFTGPDGTGFRYEHTYFIPYDFLETYGHQNLKWFITVNYNGGSFTAPGSGQHVIHVNEATPPSMNVITELAGGGTLPSGSGWDLTTTPGGFSGTPTGKDTSGLASGDDQDVSPVVEGSYTVTGRPVSGYSISYNPQSGTVAVNTPLTLVVVYTRDTGNLTVRTRLAGGGTLPNDSGWDFTNKPGDFAGSPDGKGTGGIASPDNANVSPAVIGNYEVTGRAVPGYTITYDPQSGTLTKDGSLLLVVIYTADTGTLNVITEVTGGGNIPSGGGFTLAGPMNDNVTNGGQASGTTETYNDAVIGNYNVTGKTVTGYSISYDPKSGSLAKGGNLTLKIIYTRDTGSLNVITELTGGGNLPSGSGWDLTTNPADFSGSPSGKDTGGSPSGDDQSVSPAETGNYAVTGRTVSGYNISYGPQSGSLTKGGSLTLKVIYTLAEGESLNVITELTGGGNLPSGSGWDLSTTPGGFTGSPNSKDTSGLGSGDNQFISPAVVGNYGVTGRAVSGYSISYGPQSGSLSAGNSLTLKVIYTSNTVNSYDVDAIYWDPVNGVKVSGGTINPSNATVLQGGSQNFTASVVPSGYELTGGTAFTGNGNDSMSGNVATVSNVMSDGTLRIYVQLSQSGPGELEVIIYPEGVRDLGARWRFKGSPSEKHSSPHPEGTETLEAGLYDLEFTDVPDWNTPQPRKDVEVFSGQKTTVTVIYTQGANGALQVFITDNLDERVRKIGAQWQPIFPDSFDIPNDPDKWYNHGDIISGLPVGQVGLRFKTLAGWILPELTGAGIVADTTTKVTGEYWRVLIIHKSDYNGDGTDDLAVFNKKKKQWQIASISKPGNAPSAVNLFKKKYGKEDDFPTAGDYDGDGVADLSYWRESTGEWNVYKQLKLEDFGEEHDIPVPGDYNGDGITDPALYRPSTGEWMIYDRDLEEVRTVKFGGFGYVPVPGNYDADEYGMTELAIFHVESQKWRVAFYSAKKDNWVEKRKIRVDGKKIKLNVNHGSIGNVPVQADYNGDGATDLAIYKRRASEWDVRNQFEIQLGEDGDIPVPNDWAGLGRVIPTIFNIKNGRWISVDNLLNAKHGKGGLPLMSGR